MKTRFVLLPGVLAAILLSGCLAVAEKEYEWTVNPDGSGSGVIIWRDLFSLDSEDSDNSAQTFVELINDYINGHTFESENPGLKNVQKRLFMEDQKLCAAISFDFSSLLDAGFYRYQNEGPVMRALDKDESFLSSSGNWEEVFPVVFFDIAKKSLKLKTRVSDPTASGAHSLAQYYSAWSKDRSLPELPDDEFDWNW
ncbi:hypothetical protein MASR2M29_05070 [Spirochaetota bacterium]